MLWRSPWDDRRRKVSEKEEGPQESKMGRRMVVRKTAVSFGLMGASGLLTRGDWRCHHSLRRIGWP